jgi:hypothetical protein
MSPKNSNGYAVTIHHTNRGDRAQLSASAVLPKLPPPGHSGEIQRNTTSWNLLNEDKVVAEDKIVMGQRHELPTKRVTKELGEEAETRMEIRIVNSANREAPKSANRAKLQGAE